MMHMIIIIIIFIIIIIKSASQEIWKNKIVHKFHSQPHKNLRYGELNKYNPWKQSTVGFFNPIHRSGVKHSV